MILHLTPWTTEINSLFSLKLHYSQVDPVSPSDLPSYFSLLYKSQQEHILTY